MKPLNLHETVINNIHLLNRTINPMVVIKTVFDSETIIVSGDKTQLQNAFLNLRIIARDAMPDGGEFTTKTELIDIEQENPAIAKYKIKPGAFVKTLASNQGVSFNIYLPVFHE